MKRVVCILFLVLLMSVTALAENGFHADTIYFNVKMQEDIGVQDVIAGNTDIFFEGLSAPLVLNLSKDELDKLDIYSVPSGYYDFFINPVPNKAPYTVNVDGKDHFNPFAIREIRFALNFLVNRKYVVDEILGGAGMPMYTVTVPGQPGTYKYELNASKMGFSAEGDESKALKDIEAAMNKAAQLSENKGKLVKEAGKWMYNGEPVIIKFVIRVDDPSVRVPLGEYFSLQLEKAGFTIEKVMIDRYKARDVVYNANPADLTWSMLTEAWGAGATRRFWDHIVGQMYAPYRNWMPGKTNPANWRYINDELDALVRKAYYGDVLNEQEYWDATLDAQVIGLKDALRINIAVQSDYFLANKNAFHSRFAYGLGDGINQWSIFTSKVKDKTLKITQYSAQGNLFMGAWDPVGLDGMTDTYSQRISDLLIDMDMFESPVDARYVPLVAIPLDMKTGVYRNDKGEIVGKLKVPAEAIKWDAHKDEWVQVGSGNTSKGMGKYEFKWRNFHQGIPMSMVDYLYADSFFEEWRIEEYPGDPWYEVEFDQLYTPIAHLDKGKIYDFENKQITVWSDSYSPDMNRLEGKLAPTWLVNTHSPAIGVSWEIVEALARMVAMGSTSGESYAFTGNREGATQVDVLVPKCVADIKAELKKMIDEKWIPVTLKGYITEKEVVQRYQAAIKFIDTNGNAYISNGGYYMAKYDPQANYAELKAVRDRSYPMNADKFIALFERTVLDIETIETPMLNIRGRDILVKAHVNQSVYPDNVGQPATTGQATITLITDEAEYTYDAKLTENGIFEAQIPGQKTKSLKPGSYTILVDVFGDAKTVGEAVTKSIIIR